MIRTGQTFGLEKVAILSGEISLLFYLLFILCSEHNEEVRRPETRNQEEARNINTALELVRKTRKM
jgi:hydroxymethylglutaryl-CoA reductase